MNWTFWVSFPLHDSIIGYPLDCFYPPSWQNMGETSWLLSSTHILHILQMHLHISYNLKKITNIFWNNNMYVCIVCYTYICGHSDPPLSVKSYLQIVHWWMYLKNKTSMFTAYLETGCWFPVGLPLYSGEAVLPSIRTQSPAGKQSGL